MLKCMKYFTALSFMSVIDKQLVGTVFAQGDKNVSDDDRGFGNVYKWRNLERGFSESKETGKPIFLVIHRMWCPACQDLKQKFSKSIQLIDLSNQFIMINVESGTDSLTGNQKFHPDGTYVPRILFYTPQGELISEAYNRQAQDPKFRYFYGSPTEIIEIMRFVLEYNGK